MKRVMSDEELAKLTLPELIDLAQRVLEDITLRVMEIAGDIEEVLKR